MFAFIIDIYEVFKTYQIVFQIKLVATPVYVLFAYLFDC